MTKKTIILSTALIVFTLGGCNNSSTKTEEQNEAEKIHHQDADSGHHHDADSMHHHDGDASHHEMSEAMYQCPMHPEVTSDKPGTCSKCGMNLEKKAK